MFRILRNRSIHRFNSVDEIIEYKRSYQNEIENVKAKIEDEINVEIMVLTTENSLLINQYNILKEEQILILSQKIERLTLLSASLTSNIFSKIKNLFVQKRLNYLKSNFDRIVEKPIKDYMSKIDENESLIYRLSHDQSTETERRSKPLVREVQRVISGLDNLSSFIYGAVGELRAINLLRKLPDDYYIINDFQKSFNPPLYHKSEDDWIYSTQLDHVVIGPTGIFVIETKYWSKKSIERDDLYSPIKQVRRGGFAMHIILKNITEYKVPVSNVLLMMGASVDNQFQYVEILTEDNCINYITRKHRVLSSEQILYIVNQLINPELIHISNHARRYYRRTYNNNYYQTYRTLKRFLR